MRLLARKNLPMTNSINIFVLRTYAYLCNELNDCTEKVM